MTRVTTLAALAAVTAALAVTGLPASGQEAREVQPGDRVRVTLASRFAPGTLIGTVLAAGPDTLVVERDGGGVRKLTSHEVRSVDVSVERQYKSVGKAAGGGLLVASPFLVLLGIGIIRADGPEISDLLTAAFVGVAAVGAVAGILVFGTAPQDEWVEATWPLASAPPDTFRPTAADTTGL